jgi:hypothetical protein
MKTTIPIEVTPQGKLNHRIPALQQSLRRRLILPTRRAIATHIQKLREALAKGQRVPTRTLAQKTGLKFGSGITRKFQRAHAKRAGDGYL